MTLPTPLPSCAGDKAGPAASQTKRGSRSDSRDELLLSESNSQQTETGTEGPGRALAQQRGSSGRRAHRKNSENASQ